MLEIGIVHGEQMLRQLKTLPARIVAIEPALEIAGNRSKPARAVGAHADRVKLESGHSVVVE